MTLTKPLGFERQGRGPVAGNARGGIEVFKGDLPDEFAMDLTLAGVVAWDVETTGLDWRRDRLGTCQLHSPGVGTAIVMVNDEVPQRLINQLENPNVTKVFHHAPFDLRFLMSTWSVEPTSVRCTKVASKLLNPSVSNAEHSLQFLLAQHLGVELDKGPTRTSDWRSKNLSAEQIAYAANDVTYLLPLAEILTSLLKARDLSTLYSACCKFLPTRVALELGEYPDVFAY
jgi:ribonuclease D